MSVLFDILYLILLATAYQLLVGYLSPLNCTSGSLRPSSRPRLWNSSLSSSVIVVDPDSSHEANPFDGAMPCNATTIHLEFLSPEFLKQTISILALTLTSRLVTLVLRVQKAGLFNLVYFVNKVMIRCANSGIWECCQIPLALQLVVPSQKPRRCILRC